MVKMLAIYESIAIVLLGVCWISLRYANNESMNSSTSYSDHENSVYDSYHDDEVYNKTEENNTNQLPVIVRWDKVFPFHYNRERSIVTCGNSVMCNIFVYPETVPFDTPGAYIFHLLSINFNELPLPKEPERLLWGIVLEECPKNIIFLQETTLKLFNYSSTFSRYSDVPTYRHLPSLDEVTSKKHFVKTSKKNFLLKEIAPIMYLQTNCGSLTQRDEYVRALMKFQKVDSYGPCVNNRELPDKFKGDYFDNLKPDNLLAFIARYKFVIAIESAVCEDYVTEKFWRPIIAGVVPIYLGCPKIREWYPNRKSAILLQDFPSPKLMSQQIDKLMADDELYEEYLEHKTKSRVSNKNLVNILNQRLDKTNSDQKFVCFLCDRLHGKDTFTKQRVVNKSHYNCPALISAKTLKEDFKSSFVQAKYAHLEQKLAEKMYNNISAGKKLHGLM